MKDMMSYKGYFGSVHFCEDDETLHGKVEFIRSLVTYEGKTAATLKKAFREAVDDYLDLCAQQGIDPEKPFKGSFNVRTGPELHRLAAISAEENGINLNQVVVEALTKHLKAGKKDKLKTA